MTLLLALPIFIPLTTAILCLFAYRCPRAQAGLTVVGMTALLAVAVTLLFHVSEHGVLAMQMGNWPAPFGITLVADLLGAIMVVLGGLMGVAVSIYSLVDVDEARKRFGFYPLLNILLMGVSAAFLTGDLFNLFVCFEIMLIASFVLLSLGGQRAQLEGAIKYFVLNLVSSTFFLAGVGILYGITGTLNMADLHVELSGTEDGFLIDSAAMLFLACFGIKAAVFPFFFWLPAAYHTPPVSVSAIFAGLLTKVGVYALLRTFTLFLSQDFVFIQTLLLVIAATTMVVGVLGAAAQFEVRRILSFHIISQIGYMVMGLALFTPLAIAGSVFYLMHHIIVKTNLFLIGGAIQKVKGSGELTHIGGLYKSYPILAFLFLIPAFSLAGIPPLSGFWSKLILIQAGVEISASGIVFIALAVGLMTLFSMTKIWAEAFWKPQPHPPALGAPKGNPPVPMLMMLPIIALAMMTVLIGIYAEPIFELAQRAAEQLLDPSEYIAAVNLQDDLK